MARVRLMLAPRDTAMFRKGQKLWICFFSGADAAECVGRYRGRGRYVRAWVRWRGGEEPAISEFEVDDEFATKHRITAV